MAYGVLAYLAPPLLGFALYVALFAGRRWLEGLAFAWGAGGILVNVLLLAGNQLLGVPIGQAWILGAAAAMTALAVALLALCRHQLRRWARETRERFTWHLSPTTLLLAAPTLLLAFLLVKAMAYPETGPDSVFYHLFLAKDAYVTGDLPRTAGLGWLELANAYPNLVVTQQVWAYAAAGSADQILSRPLVPLYALFLAGLLVATGNRLRRGAGPLALLLLTAYTVPATVLPEFLTPTFLPFGRLAVEIWTDVPVAFYALLGVHFVLEGMRGRGRRAWAAAGLFAGGAVLTKYNGLVFAALLAILVLILLMVRRRRVESAGDRPALAATAFLLPLGLAAGLLFLRNQWLFGNPVYPFYTELLGGVNLRSAAILGTPIPTGIGAAKWEQLYVLLTSLPLLLFLPSLRRGGARIRLLQVLAAAYVAYLLVGWSFLSAFYRMILPALPLVALSAGGWLHRALAEGDRLDVALALALPLLAWVLHPDLFLLGVAGGVGGLLLLRAAPLRRLHWPRRTRALALSSVFLLLSFALATPALQAVAQAKYPTPTLGPLPVGLPRVPDATVLQRAYGGDWDVWVWMNANLPEGARVMTLHPGRYYVDATLVCPASEALVAHYDADLDGALAILEAAGVAYVLDSVFPQGYVLTKPFWQQSPVFQNLADESRFELLYESGGHRLYRITA